MTEASRPPVQALSAREAGHAPDHTLYEGVPAHLRQPLKGWTLQFLGERLARRVGASLRLGLGSTHGFTVIEELVELEGTQLLDVIDVALQLDEGLHFEIDEIGPEPTQWGHEWTPGGRASQLEELAELLNDGGSAFEVHWPTPCCLIRRVDPTVAAAMAHTIAAAKPTAGTMLAAAYRHAYGMHPDPTAAYREAVRAVEEIACPLVLVKSAENNSASLGRVRDHFRDAGHRWKFVLIDKNGDGSIEPLLAMMDRLWTGQVSRHGGGGRSRDQSQAEAEAAVHLAATLVQWLSSSALTRRDVE